MDVFATSRAASGPVQPMQPSRLCTATRVEVKRDAATFVSEDAAPRDGVLGVEVKFAEVHHVLENVASNGVIFELRRAPDLQITVSVHCADDAMRTALVKLAAERAYPPSTGRRDPGGSLVPA